MDFRLINPDAELLGATAPGHILQLFNAKGFETLTIAGFTEEKPVCYAVFSRLCAGGDLYLEHIYAVPGEDAEENRRSLIDYCTGRFGASGFDRMISKQYVPPHEAQDLHEGYKELGFVPLFLSGRLMVYRLEDTEMAQVRPVILRNLKKLPAVCTFKEAGEKRFRSFMKKIGRGDVSGMASYIPYSYFYIAEDEINAAMLAAKSGPDRIHISLTYLDGTALKDNVFLVLLTSVLSAAEKDIGTDYTFMINVDSDVIYRGLMQVFNPPDHEFFLMEHMLPFELLREGEGPKRETGALTKGRLFPEADTLPALSAEEFDLQKEEPVRDRQEGSLEHET
ncbi:MAG: hypothetical protein K5770_13990, partial [Lachnospiraceae bacterium]|nr:hypothetical protein [Lachnospiraceae bacterium]